MAKSALPLLVAALVLAACQRTDKRANDPPAVDTAAASDTSADEKAIRGNVDRWLELVKAKDAPSISQLYTTDGAVMPPNGPIGKGRAAIQQTWA